jgi:hypothetical protein
MSEERAAIVGVSLREMRAENLRGAIANKLLRRWALVCLAISVTFVTGCGQEIESYYGSRSGVFAGSVNGTSVLADMFEQAGHTVRSATYLSPKLKTKADVIVWFPDDFEPPKDDARTWLEEWLEDRPDRTLIYVGRDYDALPAYWEAISSGATGDELKEINARHERAVLRFNILRDKHPKESEGHWFTIDSKAKERKVTTLKGEKEWLEGIDPSKLTMELNSRFEPAEDADVLLKSEGDVLVTRESFYFSDLYVVTNGSFLLNLPLVNHEHRKLAGKLIEAVGSKRRVVFLESDHDGVKVFDHEPTLGQTGYEIFGMPPFDKVILHLALVGVIFCFARLPVFGRPREWLVDCPSDFGKHVIALGKLMFASRDEAYAKQRLQAYREATRKK